MNPVNLLKSPWAATIALGLCMWAQIPHSQTVFEHWADGKSGAAFAWGFEAAVLMFVVRRMHIASWAFAGLSALINVGYYGMQDVQMWSWFNEGNWLNWLLSVVLPFAIAMYSHVLAHVEEQKEQLPAWMVALCNTARQRLSVEWAKARGIAQPVTIQATVQALPVTVQAIAQEVAQPTEDAQPTDSEPALDGAPDPTDKEAYAKWLYMEKGLTQTALAAQFGVHRNTIGKWLNGAAKAGVQ